MQKDETLSQSYSETKKNFGDFKNSAANTARAAFSDLSNDHVKHITSQLVEELGDFLQNKKEDVVGTLAVGALIGMICKR